MTYCSTQLPALVFSHNFIEFSASTARFVVPCKIRLQVSKNIALKIIALI